MRNEKGFILTVDALLATISAAAMMAIVFSFLIAPVLHLREDNFNGDFLSVYKRGNLSSSDMAYMFETSGKCGGVYDAQSGEKIYEGCPCPSSKLVGYGAILGSGKPSMIRIESCGE